MNAADAEKRIIRARSILIMSHPFYGSLALYMVLKCAPDVTETMAVDGTHLFFNPAFVGELTEPELLFVVAHEVSHLAYSHHARMGTRDAGEWNKAADYAINGDLVAQRIGQPPKGILLDKRFAGMGAEEIYSALAQEKRQNAQQGQAGQSGAGKPEGASAGTGAPANGNPDKAGQPGADGAPGAGEPGASGQPGAHGIGGIIAPGNGGEAAAAASADEWNIRARQAAAVAKAANAGTMPGFAERMVADISAPAVDFHAILADLINSAVSIDYSFLRPNRRLIQAGFYLPGAIVDGLEHLIFAVDTSGSMDEKMLNACAAVVSDAMESGKIARCTVVYCDSRVQGVQEFERGEELKLAPKGGGGTRFSPVMAWIGEHAPDATACIYLTDMECRDFGEEPGMPVFWAIHGDSRRYEALAERAPYGTPVYIGWID